MSCWMLASLALSGRRCCHWGHSRRAREATSLTPQVRKQEPSGYSGSDNTRHIGSYGMYK